MVWSSALFIRACVTDLQLIAIGGTIGECSVELGLHIALSSERATWTPLAPLSTLEHS